MIRFLEEVFVTEGVPEFTFIPPPNFNEILLDVRRPGKPVIIEGQSGTGKTTSVKKIIEQLGTGIVASYLSARDAVDVSKISELSKGGISGTFIIDDFHRLAEEKQAELANLAKIAAEQTINSQSFPKLILIGINQVGSDLIQLVPDIAKRTGIHRIQPGTEAQITELIWAGCTELGITIKNDNLIFEESNGDYWLTQQLCQTICTMNGILQTSKDNREITFDLAILRNKVVDKLKASYYSAIKEFCRGRRFRPSNDPYYKLLRVVGQQSGSIVDLNELANATPDVRGSINNIKEHRLTRH